MERWILNKSDNKLHEIILQDSTALKMMLSTRSWNMFVKLPNYRLIEQTEWVKQMIKYLCSSKKTHWTMNLFAPQDSLNKLYSTFIHQHPGDNGKIIQEIDILRFRSIWDKLFEYETVSGKTDECGMRTNTNLLWMPSSLPRLVIHSAIFKCLITNRSQPTKRCWFVADVCGWREFNRWRTSGNSTTWQIKGCFLTKNCSRSKYKEGSMHGITNNGSLRND